MLRRAEPPRADNLGDAGGLQAATGLGVETIFGEEFRDSRGALLQNIWPNDDGRSWTYRIDQRFWDRPEPRLYSTPGEAPPAPSLSRVAALLLHHPIGANPIASAAGYRLQFNGMKTTLSGAVGQNLEATLFDLAAPVSVVPNRLPAPASPAPPAGFLHALSLARPDLAAKIAQRWPSSVRPSAARDFTDVDPPTFLFGYAWVKTREFIGSYGDLNTDIAWKYLVANLRPGSTFHMQLVPDLADDVFLHARVLPDRSAGMARVIRRGAVEVLYVIDFGASVATDVDGNVLGSSRMYSYGTITYVPYVGPVAGYERALVQAGRPLDPGVLDLTIRLTATEPGGAANLASTAAAE